MGNYFVSKEHLEALIKNAKKDKHLLTPCDLEGNFFKQLPS